MQKVPYNIWSRYDAFLKAKAKDSSQHENLKKWFLYFWDFLAKYRLPYSRSEQIRLFIEKLQEKMQSPTQQKQAAYAVSLYFQMLDSETRSATISATSEYRTTAERLPLQVSEAAPPVNPKNNNPPYPPLILRGGGEGEGVIVTNPATPFIKGEPKTEPDMTTSPAMGKGYNTRSRYNEWRCLEKSGSPEWDKVIFDLSDEIKTRHYSRKTLKAYGDWIRKFQGYLRNKLPEQLSDSDVKAYLTYLAVDCNVAASTQNQAFNALLFLYRHILKKDFGNHKDIPRAKQSKYIPVVLSRREIDAVLKHLSSPYDLIVQLLYGCGLRLFECIKLRVQDFNFEEGMLSIQDGKGKKSRTVPIPRTITPELLAQLDAVRKLHEADLKAGYSGAFLDDSLEKKYPRAAQDFIWQWFFPQQSLTPVPEKKELRRYHLHANHVQEALREAVARARLTKRVTAHTFRHSFATHLLQANYDIRTIQTLLGHSDVRTTMIYMHCIPSKTVKEAKSPLDF